MAWRGFASQRGSAGRALSFVARRFAVPLMIAAALGGCASTSEKFSEAASQMPGIGLPAGAPERTAEPVAFPAVHDIPPPRNSVTLSGIEREEVERQLVSARNDQQSASGARKAEKDPKDQKGRKAAPPAQ
jgi:hypothetical protein